jgi:hypothetical protein
LTDTTLPIRSRDNYYETIESCFTTFDVQIAECKEEAFRRAFTCSAAAKQKKVVYLFRSAKKVNRLVKESDILYIGQTGTTFQRRYEQWAGKHATIKRNAHTIELYGPIRLSVCNDYSVFGKTLLEAENQLLWWYYENHFEYPPFNYTRAKDPKKKLPAELTAPAAVVP